MSKFKDQVGGSLAKRKSDPYNNLRVKVTFKYLSPAAQVYLVPNTLRHGTFYLCEEAARHVVLHRVRL